MKSKEISQEESVFIKNKILNTKYRNRGIEIIKISEELFFAAIIGLSASLDMMKR
tara:strand:- start:185 stop:349 length:165 start_codon:yes stop_codon:yes gene_type:complete